MAEAAKVLQKKNLKVSCVLSENTCSLTIPCICNGFFVGVENVLVGSRVHSGFKPVWNLIFTDKAEIASCAENSYKATCTSIAQNGVGVKFIIATG